MSLLRRLLLLPLLAPLLAVLVIGAVNPRPPVRLRLLIWTSPPLPIGVWLMLASGGGALLSAGATALALRGEAQTLQRRVYREVWPESEPPRSPATVPPPPATASPRGAQPGAGPSRAPGEPPPTVAVAYRVIRRPADQASAASTATASAASPAAGSQGSDPGDGWDAPPGEEW
ncbi:MAG: hypothetical protein AB1Z22_09550 [Synechococcaceae cyanobacterium]